VVRFDPKNPQIVYSASIVCWKSTDGGKTWEGWRGAPGGDDYQNVWINPNNPDIILLGSDQGAIVTVNGGKSWSSWYNQPTAQLYHVSADNAFPYRLYSGQQESGSVGIKSRGDQGEITFRDWQPVAAEEYGYVVADPLDPDIIIGGCYGPSRLSFRRSIRICSTSRETRFGKHAIVATTGKRSVRICRDRITRCRRALENTRRTQQSRLIDAE
jgi:hypothetical protein